MNWVSKPIVKWPFRLSGLIKVENSAGVGGTVDISGDHIVTGQGDVHNGAEDLVQALVDAINSVMDSVFGFTPITNQGLSDEGHIVLGNDGSFGGSVYIDPTECTCDVSWLGLDDTDRLQIQSFNTATFPGQAWGQWVPGIDSEWDQAEFERHDMFEESMSGGGLSHHTHTPPDSPWWAPMVTWQVVPAARVLNSRAADADFAAVAGVPVGHIGTIENLKRYILSRDTDLYTLPDGRIYLANTIDDDSSNWRGPYRVSLQGSGWAPEGGVRKDSVVADMNSEHYRVDLDLRRTQ